MNIGCRNFKKGDIIKGLQLISEPYKVPNHRDYRAVVKCTFCDSEPFETVLSDAKKRVFDGCGCQINRSNSKLWKSFKTWCIENKYNYLLDLWDYDLNNKDPDKVSYCTSDYYYFKCPENKHASTQHKITCLARPSETKRAICKQCNSFAQHAIEQFGENALDLYWDYTKNTVDPWELPHAARTTIYINCIDTDYHGSYETEPKLFFLSGGKCPYCNHKRIHPYDSFAYYYTQKYGEDFLDNYWDYDKNTADPWSIAPQSNTYIYLKCDVHGSYRIYASNFYKHNTLCAECSHDRDKSKLQEKVENYIYNNYHFNITHEYSCSIVARSPKTNRWLPYDNDVVIKNKHLIIEVMGEQHYNKNCGLIERHSKRNNTTPDQELADLQWRDEYKRQYALSQGYYYLDIPYWTEQDESYKTLIDEKIKSILTIQN